MTCVILLRFDCASGSERACAETNSVGDLVSREITAQSQRCLPTRVSEFVSPASPFSVNGLAGCMARL